MGSKNRRSGPELFKSAANLVLVAAALAALYLHLFPLEIRTELAPESIQEENGKAYQVLVRSPWPLLSARGDRLNRSLASRLVLYEDGKPLGPAHSLHQEIRTKGGGAYSHWKGRLYFSTSDNSDPRESGRRYSAVYPVQPPVLFLLVLGLGLLCPALRWYRTGFAPLADRIQTFVTARPYLAVYAFLYLLLGLAVFWRVFDVLSLPVLQAEDGDYYARFYNSGRAGMILLVNAGYLRLTSNLVYYLAVQLPPTWAPYLLTWLPALLTVFVYGLLFARRFRSLIPSDAVRFLICLALALNPLGNHMLLANSDYSSWHMLFLLILLSLGGRPEKYPRLNFLVLNLAVWGTPLGLAVVPILAVHLFRDRSPGASSFYLATMVNILAHHWLAVDSTILALNMELAVKWLIMAGSLFLNQEILAPLLGPQGVRVVMDQFPQLAPALFLVVSFLTLRLACLKYRLWIGQAVYLMLALSLTVMAGRETTYDFLANGARLPDRYFYIQALLCLTSLVLVASQAIEGVCLAWQKGLAGVWPEFADHRPIKTVLWTGLLLYFLLLNTVPHNQARFKPADSRNGLMVRSFFHDLEQAQEAKGSRQGIFMRLDKHDDWPIVIDTRAKPGGG